MSAVETVDWDSITARVEDFVCLPSESLKADPTLVSAFLSSVKIQHLFAVIASPGYQRSLFVDNYELALRKVLNSNIVLAADILFSPEFASALVSALDNASVDRAKMLILDALLAFCESDKPEIRVRFLTYFFDSAAEVKDETEERISIRESLLKCFFDNSTAVSNQAQKLFVNLAKRESKFIDFYFGSTVQDFLKSSRAFETLTEEFKSIVLIRRLALNLQIAILTESAFAVFKKLGHLDEITKWISSEDFLVQLNVLELLGKLSQSDFGLFSLLEEINLVSIIKAVIPESNPGLALSWSNIAVLKVLFSIFAYLKEAPRNWTLVDKHLPYFFAFIGNCINLEDSPDVQEHAVYALCALMSTKHGLKFVHSKHSEIFVVLTSFVSHNDSVLQEGAMGSISALLSSFNSLRLTEEDMKECQAILEFLVVEIGTVYLQKFGDSTSRSGLKEALQVIYSHVQASREERRLAAYRLLKEVVKFDWGLEAFGMSTDLLRFMLDRPTEAIKEAKVLRFEIFELASSSSKFSTLFPTAFQEVITRFVTQGPFWVDREALVATEV